MHWSADYVGLPFRWGGYGRDGVSCWGLLCLVQSEVFGRHLPRHDEAVREVRAGRGVPDGIWRSGVAVRQIDIDDAREGDALRMWGDVGGERAPLHVGTFVAPGRVLHIERGATSIIEKLSDPRAAWRPIKAYRFV